MHKKTIYNLIKPNEDHVAVESVIKENYEVLIKFEVMD